MRQLLTTTIICLLLTGCYNSLTKEDISKVKIGMTESEVISLLGDPDSTVPMRFNGEKLISLEYKSEGENSWEASIILEKGTVSIIEIDDEILDSIYEDD